MRTNKTFMIVLGIKFILFFSSLSFAMLDSNLSIESLRPLNFGIGIQGDDPLTIFSTGFLEGQNASFRVRGRIYTSYTILLPKESVNLTHASGASIRIYDFRSLPPEGANGKLNFMGRQVIFVGATRGSISMNQPTGKYKGNFTITVIY